MTKGKRVVMANSVSDEVEGQLVGSAMWVAGKERDADARGRHFSLDAAIIHAIREWMDATPRQLHHRHETDTGKQLHPSLINCLDIQGAMDMLYLRSEVDYDRYISCCIGVFRHADEEARWVTQTAAEIAAIEAVSERAVADSLYRARKLLREAIADAAFFGS